MSGAVVTVVVPVWDAYCELLAQCVESVRRQDGVTTHVIVVDNSSSAPLPPLDESVTVLRTPERMTTGKARNAALRSVNTPHVLFLDADDSLLPGSLAHLAATLDQNPDAVAAAGKHLLWSPATGTEKVLPTSPRPIVYRIARHRHLFAMLTLRLDVYPLVGCALIRTEEIRDAGGFGDADLAEDWTLRSALAFRGPIAFSSTPVVRVRVQSGSLWRRARSRQELELMYASFRASMRQDGRLPRWAHAALPAVARGHRRDARRLTRHGAFTPATTV